MSRALAAVAVLATLSACEQKAWTRDEIVDIADDSAPPDTSAQVAELEERVEALEDALETQGRYVRAVHDVAAATSEQTAHNAEVANENAIKDMTRRGACGYETVRPEPTPGVVTPVVVSRPIPCTKADLNE